MIGSYFLENDDGTIFTVNSERYGHMITDFYCLLLKNMTWKICGFNNTVPHAIQLKRIWLRNFSSWRYGLATKIMRFDTIKPFLWGYAKHCVYANKPSTLEHLKTNIRQVMADIPPNMCQKIGRLYKRQGH